MYTSFEKQHGTREGLEQVILSKRRFQYEEVSVASVRGPVAVPTALAHWQEIKANPHNYDVWFDYIRLEEAIGEVSRVREVYERAIANVPPAQVRCCAAMPQGCAGTYEVWDTGKTILEAVHLLVDQLRAV